MTTFRISKSENFVVLDKGFLNNTEISWQAKGLLAYMLSLPNDWIFNISDLANRSKNGRDATRNILKELQGAGYIQKEQARSQTGKFAQSVFLVFETPRAPFTENPSTVNPLAGKPSTENPTLLSNKELNNNLLNNKLLNDDDDKASHPAQQKKETAFSFYEQNGFGTISGYIAEKINAWMDDLPEELIIHAMKLAVESGAQRWRYVETILIDWSNKKFKTIADVQADKLRYQNQKQQQKQHSSRKPYGRQEVIPDWFADRNQAEPSAAPTNSTSSDFDFEAERQKMMDKLGND